MAKPTSTSWRDRLHEIIFEADTQVGRWFDVVLIVSILASVGVVMLDSIRSVRETHGALLYRLEWGFTILFTIEYILRLTCVGSPRRYASSFFGVVDLLGVLPTYLSLLLPGSQYLLVIRILRVLRVFRVLKLALYLNEADLLVTALRSSARKISVFLFAVLTLVVVLGSLMYLIEGEENGYTSIPTGIYWAVVTLTTVGYGDISPVTVPGRVLAAAIMIIGYGIIAVPTGIVSVEIAQATRARKAKDISTRACPHCAAEGHDPAAVFCNRCGAKL